MDAHTTNVSAPGRPSTTVEVKVDSDLVHLEPVEMFREDIIAAARAQGVEKVLPSSLLCLVTHGGEVKVPNKGDGAPVKIVKGLVFVTDCPPTMNGG